MPTYTPLESIVLTSAAASVTFSNISQNYQDLVLVAQCGVSTTNYLQIQLNSDTTMTNYSATWMEGDGSSASSGRYSGATGGYNLGGATTNTTLENISTIHFQNYANSTTYKSWLVRNDRASRSAHTAVGLWRNTSSINSILIKPFNSAYNLVVGSTFDLYAISPAAANTAQASGGTDVYYDSSYVYHVFKASGTFTPTRNLTADYLVVAGGGGGGRQDGGGGGAGGLRSTVTTTGGGGSLESALSLTASTSYTVTVGAGGAGSTTNFGTGAAGGNSVFSTITSTGGGGGGSSNNQAGDTGGSGGGGSIGTGATGGARTASPVQGFAGGNGGSGRAGGGGGAGAVGVAGATSGAGGAGAQITAFANATQTGVNNGYYAGGGGGGTPTQNTQGTGGLGGGGNGSDGQTPSNGTSGVTNTGGGGGGGGQQVINDTGKNGGSGIVIVRYAR